MPPGGFDSQPAERRAMQAMPLLWNAPPAPVTCAGLKAFDADRLGAESNVYWSEVARGMGECLPNAEVATLPGVNHDGPEHDPTGLAAMIEEFVATH